MVDYVAPLISASTSLSARLEQAGFGIGQRVIELVPCRDRLTRRETRIVNMLQVSHSQHIQWPLLTSQLLRLTYMQYPQYVANVVWKHLFGKPADNLERSTENEDECKAHYSNGL